MSLITARFIEAFAALQCVEKTVNFKIVQDKEVWTRCFAAIEKVKRPKMNARSVIWDRLRVTLERFGSVSAKSIDITAGLRKFFHFLYSLYLLSWKKIFWSVKSVGRVLQKTLKAISVPRASTESQNSSKAFGLRDGLG